MTFRAIIALISLIFAKGETLSMTESFGFFDEPDEVWKFRKARAFRQSLRQVKFHQAGRSGLYFQSNWEPDFSCAYEERVGRIGDGGKWVCDVVKLASSSSCLVYSVGSRGEFSFEADLHRRVPHCDVHVFDQTLKSVNLLCLVLLVFWYQSSSSDRTLRSPVCMLLLPTAATSRC